MQYKTIMHGKFLSRPNRFIALVEMNGKEQICHVKNTGRCRELLIPGTHVILSAAKNPARKTAFDLVAVKKGDRPVYLEVKGVTLEEDGVAMFPDAPTLRGTKHLRTLTRLAMQGYKTYVLFVIQMEGVSYFTPNRRTDPIFADALVEAAAAGVTLWARDCHITDNTMEIGSAVEIRL